MSVVSDNWDYCIDIRNVEDILYIEFKLIFKQLEDGFRIQKFVQYGKATAIHDDDLKVLIEKNKELRLEIDKKLEELSQQQLQYENYKKQQKLLSQEIKETHERFLEAKKFFKKFLKMYFTIESRSGENQIIFLQFFTEAKKDTENYSIRLLRNTKTGQYELQSISPKLSSSKHLEKLLQETKDVPGALCAIRTAFIDIKKNKTKEE